MFEFPNTAYPKPVLHHFITSIGEFQGLTSDTWCQPLSAPNYVQSPLCFQWWPTTRHNFFCRISTSQSCGQVISRGTSGVAFECCCGGFSITRTSLLLFPHVRQTGEKDGISGRFLSWNTKHFCSQDLKLWYPGVSCVASAELFGVHLPEVSDVVPILPGGLSRWWWLLAWRVWTPGSAGHVDGATQQRTFGKAHGYHRWSDRYYDSSISMY